MKGPAAFPRPMGWNGLPHAEEHQANDEQDGMSLRDYFAAKAMQSLITTYCQGQPEPQAPWIAKVAGVYADAMLAEREGRR